jgi:ferric-dicitrate binding protein FerR (iron transport regulator)
MSPAEFKKLLDRYFDGECTPEETAFIEKWYDNIHAKETITESESDAIEQRLWNVIKPLKNISFRPFLKIAAAIALLITVGGALALTFFKTQESSPTAHVTVKQYDNKLIETKNNGTTAHRITLSDGSVVTLEPQSLIRYPEVFASDKRLIELSGEAFFNVKKDLLKPFIVYSDEIVTRVLGTSFRITAFDDREEIVVAVKTGKVSVYQKEQADKSSEIADVILTPNQQLVYKRSQEMLEKQVVPTPSIVSVDSSTYFQMEFDGMPVTEIFEALEKNYGIDIQFDKDILEACVLTTKMTEEGFYERMEVICKAINAEYTNTDGAVIVTSKGCH